MTDLAATQTAVQEAPLSRSVAVMPLSDKIQIFMAAILLLTGMVAAYSSITQLSLMRKQIAETNEFAGNASWERFVEVAIEHPEMAAGQDPSKLEGTEVAAYQWFVERLLFAGEQVLYATNNDPQWRLSIKIEAARHIPLLSSEYFGSDDFCTYRKSIRDILSELDIENRNQNLKFSSIKCDPKFD
jgi:hypothetical protein